MKRTSLLKIHVLKRYERLRNAFRRKIIQKRLFRENLLTLFQNIYGGVFIVDLKGRIVFFNRESERISGYHENEILKSHFRKLLSLDDLADGFKLFYDAIHGLYPRSALLRILKKDHSSTIAEMEVAPFCLEGKLEGVIAFMRDNTERKRLEQANKEKVESFIRFSDDLDKWHKEVSALKKEVNDLLTILGKDRKYPLSG